MIVTIPWTYIDDAGEEVVTITEEFDPKGDTLKVEYTCKVGTTRTYSERLAVLEEVIKRAKRLEREGSPKPA